MPPSRRGCPDGRADAHRQYDRRDGADSSCGPTPAAGPSPGSDQRTPMVRPQRRVGAAREARTRAVPRDRRAKAPRTRRRPLVGHTVDGGHNPTEVQLMVTEVSRPRPVVAQDAIENLRLRLRGELIQPGHETYDTARTVHWGSVDRRPALIVRAEDEVDVIAAVDYARETGAPLAVRSGGHSFAGHGMVDGGIIVDLSGMKSMRIDPVRRTARVQPGMTWRA